MMGKPRNEVYQRFITKYTRLNERMGKKQFVVPYLMSSHPGSTMHEAIALAEYLRDLGYMPEQVQDFYPTPSTISTVMYYTGLDPRTMKPVYVPTNPHEKAMQRALIQYRNPKNYYLVKEALEKANRQDLIGFEKHCLIRPYPPGHQPPYAARGAQGGKSGERRPGAKPAAKNGRPAAKQERPAKPAKRGAGWAKPKAAKGGKPNSRKGK